MLADPSGHFGIGLTLLIATGVGLTFGFGAGWFGWSITIDFVKLYELLFGV